MKIKNKVAPLNIRQDEISLEIQIPTALEPIPRTITQPLTIQNLTLPEEATVSSPQGKAPSPVAENRIHKNKRDKIHPVDRVGIFSHLFYWWLLPLYWKGHKKKIQKDDIYDVPKHVTCKLLGTRLERSWTNELLEAVAEIRKSPSLVRAICKAFGPSLVVLIIARFCTDACLIGQAVLLEQMIIHPKGNDGLVYSISLCLCLALYLLLHQGWTTLAVTTGLQIRVACSCLLHRKIMKVNLTVLQTPELEYLLASVTKGLELFDLLAVYLPYILVGPVIALIVAYILWDHLGPACLIGMSFLIFLIPLQVFIGKRISKLTMLAGPYNEKGLRLVKEVAAGIVEIKQSVWEKLFMKKLKHIRRKEAEMHCKATFFHVLISAAHSQGARVMTLLSISTFILFGNGYTVNKAFLTICAIQALRIPLCLYFPLGISVTAKVVATVEKIQKILLLNEYSGDHDQRLYREGPLYSRLILMNASAKWDPRSPQCTLNNLHLGVQQGELLAVVGPAGGGKSSLLHILLGELPLYSGKITVNGHCVYCPQKPWIFPATLRKNIICTRPYQEERFKKVLEICDLKDETINFPDKDLTNIGVGGDITLSSIQRAKVNLARTVYQDGDIYLLDKPLASMNLIMATSIFNKCILEFLKAKTVVLVTDRPRFLYKADQILILQDGYMEGCGTYSDLTNNGIELHNFVEYDKHGELDQEEEDTSTDLNTSSDDCATLKVPQPDPADLYSYCRKGSSEPLSNGLKLSAKSLEININLS